MSRPRLLLAVAALLLLWWLLPWPRATVAQSEPRPPQPPAGPPSLPLTEVVLYDNGLAYFQREGEVTGSAQIELRIPARNVNDLLKSIVTEDTGGGHIAAVRLEPPLLPGGSSEMAAYLEAELLTDRLLMKAKGEQVEITLHPNKLNPQPAVISGTVISATIAEDQMPGLAHVPDDDEEPADAKPCRKSARPAPPEIMVNLYGPQGLTAVPMRGIKHVRFADPHLDAEMKRGASMLGSRHGMEIQAIRLQFTGMGRRTVRVGYATEHPLWRTSYRLLLAKDKKAVLQGWALLENTTDEDWQNISLTLMAGQPHSFHTDLATPLHLPRPMLEPRRHEALRYDQTRLPLYPFGLVDRFGPGGSPHQPGFGGLGGGGLGGLGGGGGMGAQPKMLDPRQGMRALAETERAGNYYRYTLPQRVSIPRRQAAMLPVLQRPAAGEALTFYVRRQQAQTGTFLLSFRLKNDTGMQLSAGPVTVIDRDHYGGEAMLEDLLPDGEATLSYGTDLGTKLTWKTETAASPNGPLTVRLARSGLILTEKLQHRTIYSISSSWPEPKQAVVEHVRRKDWTLASPEAWKTEADFALFRLDTVPGAERTLLVVEECAVPRQLPNVLPESEIARYPLDDLTELTMTQRTQPSRLLAARIHKGTVEETRRVSLEISYLLRHRGKEAREITLVHSAAPQAALGEASPAVQNQDSEGWHFPHQVPANGSSEQKLREDRRESVSYSLGQADRARLLQLRDDAAASPAVKAAVQQTLDFQDRLAKLEADRAAVQARRAEIEVDQRRLRANLKELPPASAAYKKHLDKFDKQEEELEGLIAQEKKLRQEIAQAQTEREAFLAGVTAE